LSRLGKVLQDYRDERGLSLRGMAIKCGVTHKYIFDLEKGDAASTGKAPSPTVDTLQKLAKGMRIPLCELMTRAGYFEEEAQIEQKLA
jgi:transcriptional regulator with XRE-family HTH domain